MFWIILGIVIIFTVITIALDIQEGEIITSWMGIGALIIAIVVGCVTLSNVYLESQTIDEQIEIVAAANDEIENEIAVQVNTYMNYEGKEFSELKPDTGSADFIAFAESYPELKSSKLIQEQIKIYKENKSEIVQLKKDKVKDKVRLKFWLFIKNSD